MNRICRTCLELVDNDAQVFSLDTEDTTSQIITKLKNCVPEIVVERIKDPIICMVCFSALNAAHSFILQCQQTEIKILEWVARLQTPSIDISILNPKNTLEEANIEQQAALLEQNATSLKCKSCEKCFVSNDMLKEHMMLHFLQIFKCNLCDFQTQSNIQYNDHVNAHASNMIPAPVQQFLPPNIQIPELYQCIDCPFNTPDLNLFREHRATHSTERYYHCSICSFSSTHQSSIRRHTKVHEKPFKCSDCKYQTLNKAELFAHMNLHSGQQFKCNYCPYFSLKRANLRRHRLRNHPDKILPNSTTPDDEVVGEHPDASDPYKVTINDIESILLDKDESPDVTTPPLVENSTATATEEESFNVTVDDIQQILQNGNDQQEHNNTPAGNIITQPVTNSQNIVFKCPTCSETFKYKYLLRKHVSIHSTDKPFECPECGLRTKTKVHLQGHMKTHGSEIVYTCDKCEYTSMYWGSMQKHNMIHTGEKPFKCPLCNYRGRYQSTVKYHMSSMHTKPYYCFECNFVTDSEAELFNHMEVHSNQNRIHDSDILYNYIAQTTN